MFKDHFSTHASAYAARRPGYPRALVDFLAAEAPSRDVAWDCGCGSGQLSVPLADGFERVIATDASAEQIAHATPHERVEYHTAPAEHTGIAGRSVDLVIVAQAAHWFDLPKFYDEVRRVAKPRALVALITYDWVEVSDAVDRVVRDFYSAIARYWPPERKMVEDGYASLDFPFEEIEHPQFEMTAKWNAAQLGGYIGTWSAVRGLEKAEGRGRIVALESDLRTAWGDPDEERVARWQVAMRVGRCK